MFAKHVICGILLLCIATEIAQASLGSIFHRQRIEEEQRKREQDQKLKESLENQYKETSKILSDSLKDIQESEQLHQKAINQINNADINEVARWSEMFKPTQKPLFQKPLAFNSKDIQNFKFGLNDGLNSDVREFIQMIQRTQRQK